MSSVTTLIIGAGQAGLAMSRELSHRGVDHLLLERGDVGHAWRTGRWDSLNLLTPNWANGMPGAPYAGPDPNGFMKVSDFAGSLDDYARLVAAPVQARTSVKRVTASGSGYRVYTNRGPFECKTLVLATGACARPKIPGLFAAVPTGVFQTTSAAYKRPDDLPEGGVLVVGASASGVQLARELQRSGRQVTLAASWHLRLPRLYRGRDIEWWLDANGNLDERFDAVEDLDRARRTPSPQLIGGPDPVDFNGLQDIGVRIVGRLSDIRNGQALFSGGLNTVCAAADLKLNRLLDSIDDWISERGLDAKGPLPVRPMPTRLPQSPIVEASLTNGGIQSILWATGYQPDFSWLDLPVFDVRGRLRHTGGVVSAPGVYAMGLTFLRRRRSHQISGVGDDARDLSDHLVRQLAGLRAA